MSKVIVRGSNVLKPPLLESEDVHVIEIYDSFNDLMALIIQAFGPDSWGLVTKDDPDWNAYLIRFGYIKATKTPLEILSK